MASLKKLSLKKYPIWTKFLEQHDKMMTFTINLWFEKKGEKGTIEVAIYFIIDKQTACCIKKL